MAVLSTKLVKTLMQLAQQLDEHEYYSEADMLDTLYADVEPIGVESFSEVQLEYYNMLVDSQVSKSQAYDLTLQRYPSEAEVII